MRLTEAVALSAGADHIWSMEAGVVIQTEPGEERSSLELVRRYLDELHERLGLHACEGDVESEAEKAL